MPSSASTKPSAVRVHSARRSVWFRMAAIWHYRELLVGLVRKELKIKYKNSVLGFLWSMLNPLLYLVIYYVAFQLILKAGIPAFPVFLLSGLLVWNLFSVGLAAATTSLVFNSSLVKKVWFPREILPLASVGAALVHFFLQGAVLIAVLAVVRWHVAFAYVPLLLPALLVVLLLTGALGVLLAAVNVYLRDTQHFLELALLAWFWFTPIVYPFMLVGGRPVLWQRVVYMLNPVLPAVLVFQRALYAQITTASLGAKLGAGTAILPSWGIGPYLAYLGAAAAFAVPLLLFGFWVFGRVEGNFAEEL